MNDDDAAGAAHRPDAGHLAGAELLAYWLHETDERTTDAIDEHLMQCERCGRALDELAALGDGVRAAFGAGTVAAVTSGAFVDRLAHQGLRIREYRLAPNGSVDCTIAPDDDMLVSRLAVPLEGVERLDAELELSIEPGVRRELPDIPFAPGSGEVLSIAPAAVIKALPAHRAQVTLLAVTPGGARRELGRYTFNHRPWPA